MSVCEICKCYEMAKVADFGGMVLVACRECRHKQFERAQAPRGRVDQAGIIFIGDSFAGEINGVA